MTKLTLSKIDYQNVFEYESSDVSETRDALVASMARNFVVTALFLCETHSILVYDPNVSPKPLLQVWIDYDALRIGEFLIPDDRRVLESQEFLIRQLVLHLRAFVEMQEYNNAASSF